MFKALDIIINAILAIPQGMSVWQMTAAKILFHHDLWSYKAEGIQNRTDLPSFAMFDIKWIRDNPKAFDEGLARRSLPARAQELIVLDTMRRDAQTRAQEIQTNRNA